MGLSDCDDDLEGCPPQGETLSRVSPPSQNLARETGLEVWILFFTLFF